MIINELSLKVSNNVKELQEKVLGLQATIIGLNTLVKNTELENKLLRERLNYLIQQIYGRKSEKLSQIQSLSLAGGFQTPLPFDELVEIEERDDIDRYCGDCGDCGETEEDIEDEELTIAGYKRKKRGRKALPAYLERVEVIHDISEEEKTCGCGLKKDWIYAAGTGKFMRMIRI